MESYFIPLIKKYQRKRLIFEKNDNANNKWKFELTNYTMKNYLYYKFYMDEVSSLEDDLYKNNDILKFILYISKIYRNNEEIEDWDKSTFFEKVKLFNSLPLELLFSNLKNKSNEYLITFIKNNFDEELIIDKLSSFKIKCSYCQKEYTNSFDFDSFFYILGYASDNQEIYKNLLETEIHLLYHRWLSLDQINNLSYLDFSIYSERILSLYNEEMKQQQEELKNMSNNDVPMPSMPPMSF